MYAIFLDSFFGATGLFNIMMQKFYFVFAAVLHKVDLAMLSMQKNEVHCVIKTIPVVFPSSTWIRKGVLNQHIGTQPTVHVSSLVSS